MFRAELTSAARAKPHRAIKQNDGEAQDRTGWCQGRDLNPRPKAYESSALPLSYPGYPLRRPGLQGCRCGVRSTRRGRRSKQPNLTPISGPKASARCTPAATLLYRTATAYGRGRASSRRRYRRAFEPAGEPLAESTPQHVSVAVRAPGPHRHARGLHRNWPPIHQPRPLRGWINAPCPSWRRAVSPSSGPVSATFRTAPA